jgi:hypothetical protein
VNEALLLAAMLAVGFVLFGIVSVSLGQDNNWDLRNYHYYNPYAFLTGRLGFDVAPAQMQSYFNPLSDLLYYFLMNHARPWWLGFIMGGLHGLALGLIVLIAYYSLAAMERWARVGLSLLCAGVGLYGPVFIGELGASQNDTALSLFVLGAVLILVRRLGKRESLTGKPGLIALTLAGAFVGLAMGLKETVAVYAVGMAAALAVIERSWSGRVRAIGIWTGALLVAFLLIRGFWLVELQNHFGNPLFPYFNNIFHSPWVEAQSWADPRYMPASFGETLVRPFMYVAKNQFTSFSNDFRDARYAVIYALALAALVTWYVRRSKKSKTASPDEQHGRDPIRLFLIVFFVVTYVVWQLEFSIIRYIPTLEVLGPLLILLLTLYLTRLKWLQTLIVVAAFLFIVVDMQALNYNRLDRLTWSAKFWDVEVPHLSDPDHTIVLIAGGRPWSYLISFFPAGTRFVRVESNFTNPRSPTRMQEEIRSILAVHQGPLFLLSRPQYLTANNDVLKAYQLAASSQSPQPIRSRHEPAGLYLFSVTRSSS